MPLSIYIIHYTKLTERKVMQCQQLKMFKGNVHFITKFDPEVISNAQYEMLIKDKGCSINTLSSHLKHLCALRLIKKNETDYCLILEDDIYFSNDFFKQLELYIKEATKNKYDVLFLNDMCNFHHPNCKKFDNHFIYEKKDEKKSLIRGRSAFIIHPRALKNLRNRYFFPIRGNGSQNLNDFIKNHKLKVGWVEPTICIELSEYMIDKSYNHNNYTAFNTELFDQLDEEMKKRVLTFLVSTAHGKNIGIKYGENISPVIKKLLNPFYNNDLETPVFKQLNFKE